MNDKVKLSELPDDVVVSREESTCFYEVGELKREITQLNEPHHKYDDWYICNDATWNPDAKYMLENYIENEAGDMYEDWDDKATDCVTPEYKDRPIKDKHGNLVKVFVEV